MCDVCRCFSGHLFRLQNNKRPLGGCFFLLGQGFGALHTFCHVRKRLTEQPWVLMTASTHASESAEGRHRSDDDLMMRVQKTVRTQAWTVLILLLVPLSLVVAWSFMLQSFGETSVCSSTEKSNQTKTMRFSTHQT